MGQHNDPFLRMLSGRVDLNHRPLAPEASALPGLRYAPIFYHPLYRDDRLRENDLTKNVFH